MPERLTDDRLRQLRDDEYVCANENERSMAAELLELRQRAGATRAGIGSAYPDGFLPGIAPTDDGDYPDHIPWLKFDPSSSVPVVIRCGGPDLTTSHRTFDDLLAWAEHVMADELRQPETINPDTIADEFGIQGLGVDNGIPTLTTIPTSEQARELLLAMSLACGRMLDDDQAPNYVEFEVSPAGHPGYVVHVRRAGGPSPHTLRKAAEARVAELEAELERYREAQS